MKKLLKMIVAPVLVAIMLAFVSVGVMAAELPQVVANEGSTVISRTVQPTALVATYYYEGSITEGKTLDPVEIYNGYPDTIEYWVAGNDGNVTIRITNRDTGDSRSFTAVANGTWGSITYISNMDPGVWDVKVLFATGSGHNAMRMRFYN